MRALVNGVRIGYEECGIGPAVVLLHAFPLCRRMWQPQLEALASAGFRVIAPDFRGFGDSAGTVEGGGLAAFAADTAALLNYLGVGRAAMVGHGLGGQVLLELLERYPRRIAAACFVATEPQIDNPSQRAACTVLAGRIRQQGREAVLDAMMPKLLTAELLRKLPDLPASIRRSVAAASPAALSAALLALRDRRELESRRVAPEIPTMILAGEADRLLPPSAGRLLSDALPHSSRRLIPDAGHLVNLERPAAFNEVLLSFLREVKWGRSPVGWRQVA